MKTQLRATTKVRLTASATASAINEAVGGRVRERREFLEMTQGQLGNLVGRDHSQISRVERGITSCDPPLMIRLARALGVQAGFFLINIEVKA